MVRALDATVLLGNCEDMVEEWERSQLADGDLRVVNAGAVGMPYEGEVAAFWTLVEDGEPSFRRTPIDVERAVAETRKSAWPHAQGFVDENLLVAVSGE